MKRMNGITSGLYSSFFKIKFPPIFRTNLCVCGGGSLLQKRAQARVLGRGSFYGAVKESCQHSLPDTGLRIFCPEETFCATEMVYQPILKVPTGSCKLLSFFFSLRFSQEKCKAITVTSFFSSDHRAHPVCSTF